MKFNIVLDKKDYLAYHLFKAASSDKLKKRRILHWAGVPVVYAITTLLLRVLKAPELIQAIFLITGILWVFLYPLYSKWAIPRYMARQISQKYTGLLGKTASLEISKNQIVVKNDENTLRVPFEEITGIVELSEHFLIDVESGFSLILPKSQIPEKDLANGIHVIAEKSRLEISNQTKWSWK